ncbi:MAG: RNA-binding protein [Chloroflexi bacterium]|nr:RNA-binding protein [Chloroflexota bacterium]
MESKLYVGNLSYGTTENDLRQLFAQAGEIRQIALITDKYSGQPKGFGFVEMSNQADAEKAIRMFNDQELDGRRLVVNIARPREERSSSGYRGGSGNRRGGRGRY